MFLFTRFIKLAANFAVREKSSIFSIICLFSTTLFWLAAISYQVSFTNIIRLFAIYSIIIPLVLFLSPKGYYYLRRTFSTPYKIPKAMSYIIVVTLLYYTSHLEYASIFDENTFERLSNFFAIDLLFFFNIISKPLLVLLAFMILFDYKEQLDIAINWRVALFIVIYQIAFKSDTYLPWFELNKIGVYFYEAVFQEYFHKMGSGRIMTPQIYISLNVVQFNLQKWLALLPVIFFLPGIIDIKNIGFGELNKKKLKLIIWTLSVFALDMGYVIKAYFFDKTSFPPIIQMFRVFYYFYLAAIYEEIAFRGIIQNYLCIAFRKMAVMRYLSNYLSIFIAAVLFSLVHYPFSYGEFVQRIILGILYGVLFYKAGTIWLSAIVHGTHNLIIYSLFYISQTYSL